MSLPPEEQALLDQRVADANAENNWVENPPDSSFGQNVADIASVAIDLGTGGLAPNVFGGFDSPENVPDPADTIGLPRPSLGGDVLANIRNARTLDAFRNPRPPKGTKTGGGRKVGDTSVSIDVSRPVPQDLLEESEKIGYNRAVLEAAYQTQRARSLGVLVDIGSEFQHGYKVAFEKTSKQIEGILDEAEQEAQGIAELVERAENNSINPGQFFANAGDAGKFAAAMAVGAGAMATAFGGGPNIAHDIITRAIDRNVRAQIANQTHGRALIAHQTNFVNTIRGLSKDRAQYGNYLRLGMQAMAKAGAAVEVNKMGQTQAKLAARDSYLKWAAELNAGKIKAITNSAARITYKLKTAAQADAFLASKGYGPQGQPIASGRRRPAGGGGPSRPGSGTGRQGGTTTADGGGSVPPTQGTRSVGEIVKNTFELELSREAKMKLSPMQLVKRAARVLQHDRGGKVGVEDRNALRDFLLASPDPDIKQAARALKNKDFEPADVQIPLNTGENVGFHIVDEKRWEEAKTKGGIQKVADAVQSVQDVVDIKMLLDEGGNIAPDVPLLRDLLIDIGGEASISTFFDVSKAERRSRIDQLTNRMVKAWHLNNMGNANNAMNKKWEFLFARKGAGLDISVWEFISDWFRENPNVSVARLGSSEEDLISGLRRTLADSGLSQDLGL